jgi:hypothetical protein
VTPPFTPPRRFPTSTSISCIHAAEAAIRRTQGATAGLFQQCGPPSRFHTTSAIPNIHQHPFHPRHKNCAPPPLSVPIRVPSVANPDTHISALSQGATAGLFQQCGPPSPFHTTSAIPNIHQQPMYPRHKSGDPPPHASTPQKRRSAARTHARGLVDCWQHLLPADIVPCLPDWPYCLKFTGDFTIRTSWHSICKSDFSLQSSLGQPPWRSAQDVRQIW